MKVVSKHNSKGRYEFVTRSKSEGATYTPKTLSNFVAEQIYKLLDKKKEKIKILDPAVGDGELLLSMLRMLTHRKSTIAVYGYEINKVSLAHAKKRLAYEFPEVSINFKNEDFLEYVIKSFNSTMKSNLFSDKSEEKKYDIIIANPPYVRTQVMGVSRSKEIAKKFGLKGRVDLYHAFILAMGDVLKSSGIAGVIVSNRFMTTKTGGSVREAIHKQFNLVHVWDLGDTKLFEVAVLPAVLLLKGSNARWKKIPQFTSIYETSEEAINEVANPIEALSKEGVVRVDGGRSFIVRKGVLNGAYKTNQVWRISTKSTESWLSKVEKHTWAIFKDIGKVRVGIKTCADKVFIRNDWNKFSDDELPELLRPLTTHHIANRYKEITKSPSWLVLYPHCSVSGKRQAINIDKFPKTKAYLQRYEEILRKRKYLIDAGRNWYELWVPQNPDFWSKTKVVFRDIAEKPVFWVDMDGTVVNGDCYWLFPEKDFNKPLIWLAVAVGNSTFIEKFYDHSFHNKLYAGRRRFMSQYVEKFPLPNPESEIGKRIISLAMKTYSEVASNNESRLTLELNNLVWEAFGLGVEE